MQYLLLPPYIPSTLPCPLIIVTSVLHTARSVVLDSLLVLDLCAAFGVTDLSSPLETLLICFLNHSSLPVFSLLPYCSVLDLPVGASPPPKPQHSLKFTLQPSVHSSHLPWDDSPTIFFCNTTTYMPSIPLLQL